MGWTLISCSRATYKRTVYQGTSYRKEGYYMYLNYAGFFFCAFLLKSKKLRHILLNFFVISALFLIIVSRVKLINENVNNVFVNNTIALSVFAQFNHYCYFLMMALMCNVGIFVKENNKFKKIVYLFSFALIGYALIYNNTFGCYLAVIIVLISYLIYTLIKKVDRISVLILVTIFAILSCCVSRDGKNITFQNMRNFTSDIGILINKFIGIEMYNGENDSTESKDEEESEKESEKNIDGIGTSRMLLWKYGIKFIARKPIFGYGPDNLGREYILEGITKQDRPHNLIIYLAGVSGIPGMIMYMTAVGIIIVRGIKNFIKQNKDVTVFLLVVITYLISSMFGNSMYYTSPYFFIFLGSLMRINSEKNGEISRKK